MIEIDTNRPLPHSMRLVRAMDELRMAIQQEILDRFVERDIDLPAVLDGELIDNVVNSVGERFNQFYRDRFNIPRG